MGCEREGECVVGVRDWRVGGCVERRKRDWVRWRKGEREGGKKGEREEGERERGREGEREGKLGKRQ